MVIEDSLICVSLAIYPGLDQHWGTWYYVQSNLRLHQPNKDYPRVVNPSTGLGVQGGHFFMYVSVSVRPSDFQITTYRVTSTLAAGLCISVGLSS